MGEARERKPSRVFTWRSRRRDPIQAYDRTAAHYDGAWRRYGEESLDRVMRQFRVGSGGRVLDVACGTGTLMQRVVALRKHVEVQGIDGSEAMVRLAREKLEGADGVAVQQARADHLPFPDSAFDWVTCCSSLHCFQHPERVMSEMRRVLRPQGWLLIMDWCRNPWHCRLLNWWKVRFDPSHVWMYTMEELTGFMERCQLDVRHAERFRVSWIAGVRVWEMMLVVAGKP